MPTHRANLIAAIMGAIVGLCIPYILRYYGIPINWWVRPSHQVFNAIPPTYDPCPIGGPYICESTFDGHKWHTIVKPKNRE